MHETGGSVSGPSENEITSTRIDASLQIHRELGPGLLESVYRELLAHDMRNRGFALTLKKRRQLIE